MKIFTIVVIILNYITCILNLISGKIVEAILFLLVAMVLQLTYFMAIKHDK